MKVVAVTVSMSLVVLLSSAACASLTYDFVSRPLIQPYVFIFTHPIDHFGLSGTIVTDGTIGLLQPSNIQSVTITFTNLVTNESWTIPPSWIVEDSVAFVGVQASATEITLPPPTSGDSICAFLTPITDANLNWNPVMLDYARGPDVSNGAVYKAMLNDPDLTSSPVFLWEDELYDIPNIDNFGLGPDDTWVIATAEDQPNVVPEPVALAVWLILGGCCMTWHYLRRNRKAKL